jgi:hypothetical protein
MVQFPYEKGDLNRFGLVDFEWRNISETKRLLEVEIGRMNLVRKTYDSGDEQGIIELQNTVFESNGKTNLEKWRWQYVENPCGPARIFLYEKDRKIVGHFALMPVALKCGEREILSGKAENGMMHKRYRGFGNHFVKLVREGIHESFQDGMSLCWGFAGPMILRPQIAAGFRHLGRVAQRIKVIDGDRFFHEFIRPRIGEGFFKKRTYGMFPFLFRAFDGLTNFKSRKKGLEIKRVNRCDERFDVLWDEVKEAFGMTIVRSSSFLNWRFVDNPNAKSEILTAEKHGELKGYIVLNTLEKKGFKVGFIGDLLFQERSVAGVLLDAAIDSFKKEKAVCISMLWIEGGRMYESLRGLVRRKGFLFKTDEISMDFVLASRGGMSSGDLSDWYITYAFTQGVRF